jgi:hypothetical protein
MLRTAYHTNPSVGNIFGTNLLFTFACTNHHVLSKLVKIESKNLKVLL